MNPPEIFKLFGPVSVFITWVTVAFLVYNWRGDKSMSISKHAAAHRSAYLMMLVIESIVLPMFFLFTAKWVVPALSLPVVFTVLVGLASAGLLLGAWIPDVTGWKGKVHGIAAYGAALLFIPASVILYLSPNLSLFAKAFALFVLTYEVVVIMLFSTYKKSRNYHLYLQSGYILFFDLSLIASAYIVK
jgi:hypothetical protein